MNKKSIEIIAKIIDIPKLMDTQPNLFNFNKLNITDKIELSNSAPDIFLKKIIAHGLAPWEKARIIARTDNRDIEAALTFDDNELAKINHKDYLEILDVNYKKYIRKEKYERFNKIIKAKYFLIDPEWVMQNGFDIPTLTTSRLIALAQDNPSFIDHHVIDFSELSTNWLFWNKMISRDKKYIDVFIKNTKSLTTKTEVRNVLRSYPEIIKKLDANILQDSKLTVKEWLLFSDSLIKDAPEKFKNWEFSVEVKEEFKLALTSELLQGKSKLSTRLRSSLQILKEEQDEN